MSDSKRREDKIRRRQTGASRRKVPRRGTSADRECTCEGWIRTPTNEARQAQKGTKRNFDTRTVLQPARKQKYTFPPNRIKQHSSILKKAQRFWGQARRRNILPRTAAQSGKLIKKKHHSELNPKFGQTCFSYELLCLSLICSGVCS